jgi:hypothetical protein
MCWQRKKKYTNSIFFFFLRAYADVRSYFFLNFYFKSSERWGQERELLLSCLESVAPALLCCDHSKKICSFLELENIWREHIQQWKEHRKREFYKIENKAHHLVLVRGGRISSRRRLDRELYVVTTLMTDVRNQTDENNLEIITEQVKFLVHSFSTVIECPRSQCSRNHDASDENKPQSPPKSACGWVLNNKT